MKHTYNIETRISNKPDAPAADRTKHRTALTIDWEGCTVEDLIPAAAQTLVINRQGGYRRNKSIPQVDTFTAKEVLSGMTRSAPMTPETIEAAALSGAMSAQQVEALLAKMRAIEKDKAKAAKANAPVARKGDGDTRQPA